MSFSYGLSIGKYAQTCSEVPKRAADFGRCLRTAVPKVLFVNGLIMTAGKDLPSVTRFSPIHYKWKFKQIL